MSQLGVTKCGKTEFRWGERTYVMGIINLSPDSFSGDGIADFEAAIAQAHRFVEEGADILDIGGRKSIVYAR
jgi:dihydropteroate synthase